MSERRAHLRMDDGSEVEIRWEPGAKFTLTVDDRSTAGSSAGTAKQEAVSPESPASTTDTGPQIEQRRSSNASHSEDLRA